MRSLVCAGPRPQRGPGAGVGVGRLGTSESGDVAAGSATPTGEEMTVAAKTREKRFGSIIAKIRWRKTVRRASEPRVALRNSINIALAQQQASDIDTPLSL